MTLSVISAGFGFGGSLVGVAAAALWLYASRIGWTMRRERGMLPETTGRARGRISHRTHLSPIWKQ